MPAAAIRDDETATLESLHSLAVLDTEPEPELDALTRVASMTCAAPISLISFIDADRQWFEANLGLPEVAQTPRDVAFCAHASDGKSRRHPPGQPGVA